MKMNLSSSDKLLKSVLQVWALNIHGRLTSQTIKKCISSSKEFWEQNLQVLSFSGIFGFEDLSVSI